MNNDIYIFQNLINDLYSGREIEFAFRNSDYSITNTGYCIGDSKDVDGNPYWQFDNNTEKQNKVICKLEEVDILIDFINSLLIKDVPLRDIFDEKLYTDLYVL